MTSGAEYLGARRCEFNLWAPLKERVFLRLFGQTERLEEMQKAGNGLWRLTLEEVPPGARYMYCLDGGEERPDPGSHHQPEGVHAPSAMVDHGMFQWTDAAWEGLPLEAMVLYELHIGTFTSQGDFEAVIPRLDELHRLGVNTLNLMPVAQFPGSRNWGYDGVYPFAVQQSYGGPEGLKKLVDACHARSMAVVLDVVYNHLGPEGNYLPRFAPCFTDRYRTAWGGAINYDGEYSDGVREFFIRNALFWFQRYHVDGLRLDAVHGIVDQGAWPFLAELSERVESFSLEAGRKFILIAESDLNDPKVIRPRNAGGYGCDAQWCDDFHHALRTLLRPQKDGYFGDFGSVEQLARSCGEGYVYTGQYSKFRKRRHGISAVDCPPNRFIVYSQNHDQIGNSVLGERLPSLVSFESLKLAAATVMFSPYVPLLFMGEEYGETAPFSYFVSHSDPLLIESVRQGRKREFQAFHWQDEPHDPQSKDTFERSRLDWTLRSKPKNHALLEFYRRLLHLRRVTPGLGVPAERDLSIILMDEEQPLLVFMRSAGKDRVLALLNFSGSDRELNTGPLPGRLWRKLVDSAELEWKGPGPTLPETFEGPVNLTQRALSAALYRME